MNKKIFTLLASSLMLFLTAMVVNAQTPLLFGKAVANLPNGQGKGAYHLQVTNYGAALGVNYTDHSFGTLDPTAYSKFLSIDAQGRIRLVNSTTVNAVGAYKELRASLWCVDVEPPHVVGPIFRFTNKEYERLLSVSEGPWVGGPTYDLSVFSGTPIPSQWTRGKSEVYNDGHYTDWAFSSTYDKFPLEQGVPLVLEIDGESDYFMTFAYPHDVTRPEIELVRVHGDDLKPSAPFYQNSLLFFRLVTAAPRVLSAAEFNSKLGTQTVTGTSTVTLKFNPNTVKSVNPLDQPLKAIDVAGYPGYLNLSTANNQLLYVADGDAAASYHNPTGKRFPIIKQKAGSTAATSWQQYGQGDFRFVYYPSEDSLMANVRHIDHIFDGPITDPGTYNIFDDLFNVEILNNLSIRLQDLNPVDGSKVITVYDASDRFWMGFGNRNCALSDDRATVPANLYVIRDQLGRYLVMPLEVGDFTPRWMYLNEWEKPLKTPSYQWLITQDNPNSMYSRIHLTNREFADVSINFSQIYALPTAFNGYIKYWDPIKPTYGDIVGQGAKVYYKSDADAEGFFGSFKIVLDDPDVAALIEAGLEDQLTEDQWQRRYRTSPYLGYKYFSDESLHYFAYAFNYLNEASKDYFLYTPEIGKKNANGTQDSTLVVAKNRNHFQLVLPRRFDWSMEKYGIGYGNGIPGFIPGGELLDLPETEDIARLVRNYYYIQQNDYWNFSWENNFLTLDTDGHYVFTTEGYANESKFQRAQFYLRFTYQPDNNLKGGKPDPIAINNTYPEYYTLLHRVHESNFDYINNTLGLQLAKTIRDIDFSHSGWNSSGYGVLSLSIDDWNLYARAQTKTLGAQRVSSFALTTMSDPLYRRFNNELVNTDCGDTGSDVPRTLKIYRTNNPFEDYIFEDQYSTNSYGLMAKNWNWKYIPYSGNGIHFAGVESKSIHASEVARDKNHFDDPWHNYAIYVDTAYVNRGTGHIKPQYMLAVGVKFYNGQCTSCNIPITPATYGRYLMNMTDSARVKDFDPELTGPPDFKKQIRDKAYIWDESWDRLAFVPAVHVGDTLYILNVPANEAEKFLKDNFIQKVDNDVEALNYIKLGNHLLVDKKLLDDNFHKDYVWSMRFFERNNYEDFLLESETLNRDSSQGRMIAPMYGGWVKIQNHELVISRGSYADAILEAEKWNTECANMTPEEAVSNEAVAAVKVIAGEGSVTILNAAGKQVVINNVLGQTVAKAVLTSDNATIAAPKGVLVVAVEGESAVKAVVK